MTSSWSLSDTTRADNVHEKIPQRLWTARWCCCCVIIWCYSLTCFPPLSHIILFPQQFLSQLTLSCLSVVIHSIHSPRDNLKNYEIHSSICFSLQSFIIFFYPKSAHFFLPGQPQQNMKYPSKLYYYVKNNIIHSRALGVRIVWTQIEWLLSDCSELFVARWNQLLTPEF